MALSSTPVLFSLPTADGAHSLHASKQLKFSKSPTATSCNVSSVDCRANIPSKAKVSIGSEHKVAQGPLSSTFGGALVEQQRIPFLKHRKMKSTTMRQRVGMSPSATLATQDVGVSTKAAKEPSSPMSIEDVILYGEFCELTMDAVDLNQWSRYRGQMTYPDPAKLLDDSDKPPHLSEVSAFQLLPKVCPPLESDGYEAKVYLYASEDTRVAKAIVRKGKEIAGDKGICIGYVAYSKAAKDIVVVWRGTGRAYEWLQDAEVEQTKYTSAGENSNGILKEGILPPPVAKPFFGLVAGLAAAAYGGIPALAVFSAGSILSGLADGEELFAVLFTALYAAFASLPMYRKLLPESSKKELPNLFPGLPPAGNWAVVYALGVGLLSLLLNSVVVTAAPFPFTLFEGGYWGVNALLVGLFSLLPLGITAGKAAYAAAGEGPFVHRGFWEFYRNVGPDGKELGPTSSRSEVLRAVTEYIEQHKKDHGKDDHSLTITCTGHSLGGAMAALSAFDIAESGVNIYPSDGSRVSVRAVTFEGPRVGNPAFKQRWADQEGYLKFVRIANPADVVPDVPKAFFLQNIYFLICTLLNWEWGRQQINNIEKLQYTTKLPSAYEHPDSKKDEHKPDSKAVTYIKRMGSPFNLSNNFARLSTYHNLELNLYMLSLDKHGNFTRDVALVNKTYDNLDPRMGIAPNWLQTLSPDVTKAPGTVEHPLDPIDAAMIEPYYNGTNGLEDKRRIGRWNSDNPEDPEVQLTMKEPAFDAAETKAQLLSKK